MEGRRSSKGSDELPGIVPENKRHGSVGTFRLSDLDSNIRKLKLLQKKTITKIKTCSETIKDVNFERTISYLKKDIIDQEGNFNFHEFTEYYNYIRASSILYPELKEVKNLLLQLGFKSAYVSLMDFLFLDGYLFYSTNTYDAMQVGIDIRKETDQRLPNESWYEKIELLYRVRHFLKLPSDTENNERLNKLAKESTNKSFLYFLLGFFIFSASIALIILTHGIALPYISKYFLMQEFSLTAGIFGSQAGLAIMKWQREPYATSIHNFWNNSKNYKGAYDSFLKEDKETDSPSSPLPKRKSSSDPLLT